MVGRWAGIWAALVVFSGCVPASIGAGYLLRPERVPVASPPLSYDALTIDVGEVHLDGWLFRPSVPSRGVVIYLHGRDGNRALGARVAQELLPLGFTVFAYDQRAHGSSSGEYCTFGYLEKRDLSRVIDSLDQGPVYVLGHSMGGGVALQAAADDPRIEGVVAIAPFANLEALIRTHAPMMFTSQSNLDDLLAISGARAGFRAQDVSPERAAEQIRAPVLLVHGTADQTTPSAHSLRIFQRLPAPDRSSLVLVAGAGHTDLLETSALWDRVRSWLAGVRRASDAPEPYQPEDWQRAAEAPHLRPGLDLGG